LFVSQTRVSQPIVSVFSLTTVGCITKLRLPAHAQVRGPHDFRSSPLIVDIEPRVSASDIDRPTLRSKKELNMKAINLCLLSGLGLALAAPVAFAQSGDVAYCNALADKYERYVGNVGNGRHSETDQNADAKLAVNGCRHGDTAGIPVLEKVLTDNRFELPPRG
jgi:hypothetical protein